eukprot:gene19024-22744_t
MTCNELIAAAFTVYDTHAGKRNSPHVLFEERADLLDRMPTSTCVSSHEESRSSTTRIGTRRPFLTTAIHDGHLRAAYMSSDVHRNTDRHREVICIGGLRQQFVHDSADHYEDGKATARKPILHLGHATFPNKPDEHVPPTRPWCTTTIVIGDVKLHNLILRSFLWGTSPRWTSLSPPRTNKASAERSECRDPGAPLTALATRPPLDLREFEKSESAEKVFHLGEYERKVHDVIIDDMELANAAVGGATVGGARIGNAWTGGARLGGVHAALAHDK